MSEHYDCEETRAHYHQVRRGEVTPDEMARYDDHLGDCEACQAFVLRMDGMLDAARDVDVVDEVAIDRDDLFSKIMADVEGDSVDDVDQGATDGPRLREVSDADEELDIPRSPRRWVAVAMLAAALVVAGLGVVLWMEQAPDAPLDVEIAQGDRETAPTADRELDETIEDKPSQGLADERPTFAAMKPLLVEDESIRVFTAKPDEVAVSKKDDATSVNVKEGTVLVEFTPKDPRSEKLAVRAGELTVRVVGTIFYVHRSTAGSIVGVVTGKVEVTTQEGESLFLTDGQEYDADGGIRTAREATRDEADAYVDVDAHDARLAARRDSAPTPVEPPPSSAERAERAERVEPEASGDEERGMSVLAQTLRDQASEAVRMRQYSDAARLLEDLIVELPSGHPAAMSARLDLSRIYMRQLDEPTRAVPHLKRFIVDRPDDPATPSARTTLCRILEAEGETDTACEEL